MTLTHISYSAIKDWYNCAYYFKLKHVEKIIKEESNAFLAFGKTIHLLAERSDVLLTTKNNWSMEQLDRVKLQFDLSFLKELKDISSANLIENKSLIQDMRNQGKNIIPEIGSSLQNYFGKFNILSAEESLLVPITVINSTNLKFKGFIDLIVKTSADNKFHIIDFKSTSWGWDSRKKSEKIINYQLTLYKIFWAQKHNIPLEDIETHFILLKRIGKKDHLVEPFRVSSGKKKIANVLEFIRRPIEYIEKQYFPKKKTSNCAECIAYKNGYCNN